MEIGTSNGPNGRDSHARAKAEEDRDAPETGQRCRVQVPLLGWNRDHSMPSRKVAHVAREHEREEQSREEQPQTNYSQLRHLIVQVWANVQSV